MTTADIDVEVHPGSFRDPAGRIVLAHGRVFRIVSPHAWSLLGPLVESGTLASLTTAGRVWPATLLEQGSEPPALAPLLSESGARVLEHPVLPFVSYPYEWPFSLARRAALHHLDLHLEALDAGYTLVDGTAYNVQFVGTTPTFIDTLSLVPYSDRGPWLGYHQFCTQFLNPLLLMARVGIGYHAWFRGALEGIGVVETARLLPWRSMLSWPVLAHVILHARLIKGVSAHGAAESWTGARRGPSKLGLVGLLGGLRRFIAGLKPKGIDVTPWANYEKSNSYAERDAQAKREFVARFVEAARPAVVWDLGCNTGVYSEVALGAGAGRVVGFDFDLGALEAAVARADARGLNLLPLLLDATNPSPNQGWRQRERSGLAERVDADAILALAFLHHLVIGRNIPLVEAVDWLVDLAKVGVIEFVPKEDPMVARMLAQREDIFPEYRTDTFRTLLQARATIVEERVISPAGRTLFQYARR